MELREHADSDPGKHIEDHHARERRDRQDEVRTTGPQERTQLRRVDQLQLGDDDDPRKRGCEDIPDDRASTRTG
jgi:hypothetical protein